MQKLAYSIQMESFFDELHLIEKQAMLDGVEGLQKEALGLAGALNKAKGLVSDIGLGAQRLSKRRGGEGIMKGLEDLGGVWRGGADKGGTLGGIGAVLGTRRGKALAAGGLLAGSAVAAPAATAGYAAGGRNQGQNVYVR